MSELGGEAAFDTYTATIRDQSRMIAEQQKEIKMLQKAFKNAAKGCVTYYLESRIPHCYKHWELVEAEKIGRQMLTVSYWLTQEEKHDA